MVNKNRGEQERQRTEKNVGDEKAMRKTGSRALRDKRGAHINDGCRQTRENNEFIT